MLVIMSPRSVLTFTDASEQDLGLYTVELSGNPDISSSFTFTAEGRYPFLSLHNALPDHIGIRPCASVQHENLMHNSSFLSFTPVFYHHPAVD